MRTTDGSERRSFTLEEKNTIHERLARGETITNVSKTTGIKAGTIRHWIYEARNSITEAEVTGNTYSKLSH